MNLVDCWTAPCLDRTPVIRVSVLHMLLHELTTLVGERQIQPFGMTVHQFVL
jgi:hypothetical protein